MKTQAHSLPDMTYQREHLNCGNYIISEQTFLEIIEITAGERLVRENAKRTSLVFVMTGEVEVSTGSAICQRICAQQMFLIPAGDNFYGHALTDTHVLRCSITKDSSLCNQFTITQLQSFLRSVKNNNGGGNFKNLFTLTIHPLLLHELESTIKLLQTGMVCLNFQNHKKEIFLTILRAFYQKEELAMLFAPILSSESDFKEKVMLVYSEVKTAQELMERLHMSPTAFKRAFHKAFGMPVRQWLIQKKKEKILRDIIMTDIPIAELAYKYFFTINYMTAFCRKHYGKSPTELRQERRK